MEKPTSVNYDSLAEAYNEWAVPSELSQRFHAAIAVSIREILTGNVVVVDLGCGPGDFSVQMAQHGIGVIAADISEKMLRILSRKFVRNANFHLLPCRVDAHHLPLERGTIDAVLGSQIFHFVSDPMAVVAEIKRVLSGGGLLVINGPSDRSSTPVSDRANQLYRSFLSERGWQEPKSPGWTSREIHENLSVAFCNQRRIESPNLQFEFRAPFDLQLRKLEARYTAFQIGIDRRLHDQAISHTKESLAREFGAQFSQQMSELEWTERLTFYWD